MEIFCVKGGGLCNLVHGSSSTGVVQKVSDIAQNHRWAQLYYLILWSICVRSQSLWSSCPEWWRFSISREVSSRSGNETGSAPRTPERMARRSRSAAPVPRGLGSRFPRVDGKSFVFSSRELWWSGHRTSKRRAKILGSRP